MCGIRKKTETPASADVMTADAFNASADGVYFECGFNPSGGYGLEFPEIAKWQRRQLARFGAYARGFSPNRRLSVVVNSTGFDPVPV
jgi:hypothetical protein